MRDGMKKNGAPTRVKMLRLKCESSWYTWPKTITILISYWYSVVPCYIRSLKKWGLYWICIAFPSFCDSVIEILSFRNLSDEKFSHTFLRNWEAKKIETCYTCGHWADVSCIPGSCCCSYSSFIFSFFFLSNIQTLNIFVTFFSGPVRPRRLKLVTHVNNGWMYRVYRDHAAALFHPFNPSFFFLSNFQALKHFVTLFSGTVRPSRLKLGTHMDIGQMFRVYWDQTVALILPFLSFFFLSNFQALNFFVTLFSGMRGLEDWNLIHTWTVSRCMCIPEFNCCCLFVPIFLYFSLCAIFKR